jgi:hypothetical protein
MKSECSLASGKILSFLSWSVTTHLLKTKGKMFGDMEKIKMDFIILIVL